MSWQVKIEIENRNINRARFPMWMSWQVKIVNEIRKHNIIKKKEKLKIIINENNEYGICNDRI